MSDAPVRVLLVDDQPLFRAGVRAMVEEPGIVVVGECGDGRAAVDRSRELRPDVVVMDIRMPRSDGLEATRAIVADPALSAVRVLVLTLYDLDEYVYEALRSGASGFLLKDVEPADLVAGVRVVARGDAMLAPAVTRRLIDVFAAMPVERSARLDLSRLTAREHEVLLLVVAGLANDRIAERLVISVPTAKTHVSRILAKLGARDRAQLVVLAYESGLVQPGSAARPRTTSA